ncbi:MAG: GNAT family N-acetyltransferase [Actinomycetota bacterium]
MTTYRCPTIHTERLTLRPFRDDDVDAYFAVHDTPEVRGSLHLPDSFDREEAWKHLAIWNGQWTLRNSGQWAVEVTATGEFIGRAGTHRPLRDGWPGLEVGWTIHPDHWGQGYATEAGRASVDWAFANHAVDELVSVILPDNAASQAVARRLGFSWGEERTLPHFVQIPHGIWRLTRPI